MTSTLPQAEVLGVSASSAVSRTRLVKPFSNPSGPTKSTPCSFACIKSCSARCCYSSTISPITESIISAASITACSFESGPLRNTESQRALRQEEGLLTALLVLIGVRGFLTADLARSIKTPTNRPSHPLSLTDSAVAAVGTRIGPVQDARGRFLLKGVRDRPPRR